MCKDQLQDDYPDTSRVGNNSMTSGGGGQVGGQQKSLVEGESEAAVRGGGSGADCRSPERDDYGRVRVDQRVE